MATVYERFERLPNGKYRPVVGNKPAAVGKDSATVGSMKWFADASESEVAAYMDKRLDAAADKEIAAVLPLLKVFATAKDGKEEEAQALGLEGEEDSEETELRHGQIISNDDEKEMTIAERISTGYRAAKDFWKKSATRNRQRSQFAGSTGRYASATATDDSTATTKPSKHDLVAANAKSARQTSMFKRF